jgi:hypothetical protein
MKGAAQATVMGILALIPGIFVLLILIIYMEQHFMAKQQVPILH